MKNAKLIFFSLMVCAFCSCRTNKNITYFKDIPDSLYLEGKDVQAAAFRDPLIQPNDLLQISIATLEPAINAMLNSETPSASTVQPGDNGTQGGSSSSASGFLVDKDGFIELPIIGKIKLTGLTTAQARDSIHHRVAVFYKAPVVNVKFSNFSITVLGEVARPATYIVPNEKVSILDAIGMAGDLTIYGKRENILLVRDSLGQKKFVRFNLNTSATIQSPFFYLRQGDLVYVEPNKSKIQSTDAAKIRTYSLLVSVAAVLVALITRF